MAAPQQSGQQEGGSGFIWILGAIIFVLVLIWISFKKQIVTAFAILKTWEIKILSIFTSSLSSTHSLIFNLEMKPEAASIQDVMNISYQVGDVLRFPIIVLFLILAVIIYRRPSAADFKHTYSMRDLAQSEKNNWPQITPILNLNLIKTDIDKGSWAMAMTPIQFCKRYQLLEEHRRQFKEGQLRKGSQIEVTLKRSMANRVLALQIGPLWQGTDTLPLYIKALFAAFAARYNNDTKTAAQLLSQISASADSNLNFTGTEELCKKYENTKGIQQIIRSHAYVLTVMASMLEAARQDGVQASADFLWLKPVDRRLWYMLNTVGRQTPFVEVAGPFAHWIAEKRIGRGLLIPMIEQATQALEIALKEIIYEPD